jgi:hypothetical protein
MNSEVITLIGRWLREAAGTEELQSQLPETIKVGLERLNAIDTAARAGSDVPCCDDTGERDADCAAAQPSAK